jgi:hypothetical protein
MPFIASYTVKAGSRVERFYIRPEGTPNTREHATRFEMHHHANLALIPVQKPVANYTVIANRIERVEE